MTVPLGALLHGEPQALIELEPPGGPAPRPRALARTPRGGFRPVVAEEPTVVRFVSRGTDDADFFDPAVDRLFGNDLEDGLGQAVTVDEGQHGLLHRVGSWVLPGSPPRRRDDRLGDLHRGPPFPAYAESRRSSDGCRANGFVYRATEPLSIDNPVRRGYR